MAKKTDPDEERKRILDQLKLVNQLAERLPWIAVIIIFLSMILIMVELYFQ